jgi:hypothetical protein
MENDKKDGSKESPSEKRKHTRFSFVNKIKIEWLPPLLGMRIKADFAESANISAGGILLHTPSPHCNEAPIRLYIQKDIYSSEFCVEGLVVRSEVNSSGYDFDTAVKFTDVDERQLQWLKELIESYEPPSLLGQAKPKTLY